MVTVGNLKKFLNPVRKSGEAGKFNKVFESCEKMW